MVARKPLNRRDDATHQRIEAKLKFPHHRDVHVVNQNQDPGDSQLENFKIRMNSSNRKKFLRSDLLVHLLQLLVALVNSHYKVCILLHQRLYFCQNLEHFLHSC